MSDKFEVSIETRDLAGGPPAVLFSSPLLHDFYWLPDGRVVYSLGDVKTTGSDNCNLWSVRVNAVTGALDEQPSRLTNWAGSNLDSLSAPNSIEVNALAASHEPFGIPTMKIEMPNAGVQQNLLPRLDAWNRCVHYTTSWDYSLRQG